MMLIAGVDEAGRGPLAGPVVAAAVILDPHHPLEGLADSKKLSEARRIQLDGEIRKKAIAWSVMEASVEEIESLNILHATMLAMKRAIESLAVKPDHVLIDGNRAPELKFSVETFVKGDSLKPGISAASILAKVYRDRLMVDYDRQFPGYGLARHKGYPTKVHLEAIGRLGVTPIHRQNYAPVRQILERDT